MNSEFTWKDAPTAKRVRLILFVSGFALSMSMQRTSSAKDLVVTTTPCKVMQAPQDFHNKIVQFRSEIVFDWEGTEIIDRECRIDSDIVPVFPDAKIGEPEPGYKPEADDQYQKLLQLADATDPPTRGADGKIISDPTFAVPQYRIFATFTGRLESAEVRNKSGHIEHRLGFGNLNANRSRLFIRKISDVVGFPRAGNRNSDAGQMEMDRTLGGLTVGVSTIEDAKHMFGNSLETERGLYVVRFDGACKLGFSLEDVPSDRTPSRIMAISLQRPDTAEIASAACEALKTGQGLTLLGSLDDVRTIYGPPAEDYFRNHGNIHTRVLGYDNSALCRIPNTRTFELVGLRVEWSESSKHLIDIDVSVSAEECSELSPKSDDKDARHKLVN